MSVTIVLLAWLGVAAADGSDSDLLAMTPEMERFVATHVDPRATPEAKLRQLLGAVLGRANLGIEYDEVTHTAAKTFETRRANCLSFSTMFVAMARHAGLKASYQEVNAPPEWTMSNDAFVLNQHVNVVIELGSHGRKIIDFNVAEFRATYEMRPISDRRAAAHYYNNVGVERMQAGDRSGARASFERAIEAGMRRFAPAWTNLGTLHLRNGDRERAEAAYLEALRVDRSDLAAMSNLARLYELSGDHARAARYHRRVRSHRHRNPYYRYNLALRAYAEHRYDEAIAHLRYAIRKRGDDERFYSLMASAYLGKGDAGAARRTLAAAPKRSGPDGPLP